MTLEEFDAGWRMQFDRSALTDLDPKTTAEIMSMLAKEGHVDTDEVRKATGREPYGKKWSEVPLVDGNRRPADKMAKIADAQVEKGKKSEGRPKEKMPDTPDKPRPSD